MQTFEQKLLNTVKKDDIKSFNSMMRDTNLGNLRMGRFPVLSLLYLYGARRILSAYETGFLKISKWESVGEPIEVSQLFAKKAGKCMRLYFDEIVSPLEMLLILDRTRRVKKAYPVAKPSEAVRKRLKAIYSIKYALNVSYRGTNIALDRRPLTRREKRRLALACIGCLLILAIVIATPVTVAAMLPDLDAGEVTKLKHIDFSSRETYTVLKDIVIPDSYSVKTVNCSFKSGGGRLIFGKGATLGQFNGKLENIEICTAGSPIFETCTNLATLENVTVNVDADISANSDTAFVAKVNYGTFKNVKVNARGKVRAVADESSGVQATSMALGGIVAQNVFATDGVQRIYGTLENCSVNFDGLSLEGELEANASFGGLVGENYGVVRGCTVTGKVSANTVDLGGVCYFNGNEITDVTCNASLFEVAEDEGWTTVVGGIAIENSGNIEGCVSASDLTATSAGDARCGGIAAQSTGNIALCASSGELRVNCVGDAICGGVLGWSEIGVENNFYYIGSTSKCLSTCVLSVTAGGDASYLGGIVGIQQQGYTLLQANGEDGKPQTDADGEAVTERMYFANPVTECIFMGGASGNFDAVGSILGGCGKHVYDANSYLIGGEERAVFDGNFYSSSVGFAAFGIVFTDDDKADVVADKGARAMSRDEISASDLYKEIMARIAKDEPSEKMI